MLYFFPDEVILLMDLAERLTAARKAAGITQEQLADALHVARSTISNWERGQRQPDLDTLRQLGRILRTDLLSSAAPADTAAAETGSQAEEDARNEAANAETPDVQAAAQPAAPRKRTRLYLGLAAVLICIALLICLILLPALRSRPAAVVSDRDGRRYAIADYDKTTPNEAGKAYLSILKTLSVRPGDGRDYYTINFTAREDNGVAFSITRLDMVIFFTDHAVIFAFSHNDLAGAGYDPEIPTYSFLPIDNGFPTDQNGLQGMGIRIMGRDANGAELSFTGYLPIPQ